MKKILSVLLAAAMMISCLPAAVAGETPPLRFALASDLHYNLPDEEFEHNNNDDIFFYANRRAAMENESGVIIDEFLRQCAEDDSVQYVLISGDMADNGKTVPPEHYAVAQKLREFEKATGKDVFVINGNHDAGDNCATTLDDFKTIYAEFGYDKAIELREDDCSYTADLGYHYRLIALDSNAPDKSTEDGMTLSKINWVKKQAKKAYEDGRYPVLMMHHNLLEHMPLQRIVSHDFIVRFHNTTAALFADMGIKLVMSGHEHCSDATSFTSPAGNVIYDFATTSLTMYPLQYRVMTLSDGRIDYEARTVDKIDTSVLKAEQPLFTDGQLSLMDEGLNAYAKTFLKKGVEYRLELSLTPEKMHINEDDFYYDLIMTAVNGLTDIVRMPLYGENSISELAAQYNIVIPETDYETGWDLATSLVAEHYAGGEAYDLDSPEVTALLCTVALILRTDLPAVNDRVFMRAATELLEKNGHAPVSQSITKLCCKVFGGVKPGEYFLTAALSPFLYEFAFDNDGVDDNNGTLSGYTETGIKNNAENVLADFAAKIRTFFMYIKLVFNELAKA